MNMNNIGERIFNLRREKNFSQGDLAEKLDVSRQTISKWENNLSVPEIDKFIALSELFGVSVDYLVKGEKDVEAEDKPKNNSFTQQGEAVEKAKTILIDPNKRVLDATAISLGTICLLLLFINLTHIALTATTILNFGSIGMSLVTVVINLITAVSLLSRKYKLLGVSLGLYCVYSAVLVISKGPISVFDLLTYASMLFLYFVKDKKKSKILFSSSLATALVGNICRIIISVIGIFKQTKDIYNTAISAVSSNAISIAFLAVTIGICLLLYRRANPLPTYEVPESSYPGKNIMYVNMIKHILLLTFTFGIYNFIWIYRTTENLNGTNEAKNQNGANQLLLCGFVPFYQIYWFYTQAKRLENKMRANNINGASFKVTVLILAIFLPFVGAAILLQSKMNDYCEAESNLVLGRN